MPHRHPPIPAIDDDAALRELAREALSGDGYDALTLRDHEEALRALAGRRFAPVLADTAGVGIGDPWPALEAVPAAAGGTPAAIVSAHNPAHFAGYADRGFAGRIARPFDLGGGLATVRAPLAGSSAVPSGRRGRGRGLRT